MAKAITWRGKQVLKDVKQNMSKALGEFGLRAEGHSKKELVKGHGVITGTLRRSIHTAQPGYQWANDFESSSELGGQKVDGLIEGTTVVLQLGSGLGYALPVHQGHHSFQGYHFLTNGIEKAKKEMPGVLKKYELKK